jgi:hypothetical protein
METKRSESVMNLAAALAVAQGQIKTASKDAKGNYSKYSTLDAIWDACRQPLAENGLSVVQIPLTGDNGFSLETILLHSSGEWVSGALTLAIVADRMNEHQALGTAITYARRYALAAMVGVASGDDDDGTAAGKLTDGRVVVERTHNSNPTNGDMSLDKLLTLLRKVEVAGMATFYQKPEDILACRGKGATLPAPGDTAGWRELFADARNFAIDRINEAVEREDVSLDQLPTIQGFGQVEPGEGFATESPSAMDEVETEDQTPF